MDALERASFYPFTIACTLTSCKPEALTPRKRSICGRTQPARLVRLHSVNMVIVYCICSFIIHYKIKSLDAGSDVANLSTMARQDGDHFVLNGIKAWVTSGYEAQAAIVFATINKSLKHKGITGM